MKFAHLGAVVFGALTLAACGGDDNSSGSTPTISTLNVTLSAPSVDVIVQEGGSATFSVTANYTGTPSGTVFADVQFKDRRFALAGNPAGNGSSYGVDFKTVDLPAGGKTATEVTFRLCTDANCTGVYPGSTKTFTVNLDVRLEDWGTFQRNGAHTGYVAANYDVANFTKVWEVTGNRLFPPAATADTVLVTMVEQQGTSYPTLVRALSTADGTEKWKYDLGSQSYVSGPAVAGGLVHVTSMESSSGSNPQWVFDLATGAFKQQMHFASQWSSFNQPVPFSHSVYLASGYYGNVVYAFDPIAGAKRWDVNGSGGKIWDGQSPAVDGQFVYYYSGTALDVIDRNTGVIVRSIADPDWSWGGYSWQSAPVLDGKGKVFLFSSDRGFATPSNIMSFDTTAGTVGWKSTAQYNTAFAYANGTIYAVRSDAHVLSAIDAESGSIKWSTPLPTSDAFTGNVVVAGRHAFVSTDGQTWAIDLKSDGHKVVWSAPTGGKLAITPGNLLLTVQNTKMTAYKLF
jgi:hypothetical protein